MGRSEVGPSEPFSPYGCESVSCETLPSCSLEENDKIKSEINPRKINEPKTPFHGPMEEEPGCGELGVAALPFGVAFHWGSQQSILSQQGSQGCLP